MTHWTKEICQREALKYQTKRDFSANNRNAYEYSYKHNFLDEICQHMIKLGNRFKKCIYVYEFPDDSVYVGITNDFYRRKHDREKRIYDTVTKYIRETGLHPVHRQLTDYLDVKEAVFLEEEFVKAYKKIGYKILNQIKTGGIGGDTLYWTHEKCIEEGLKHNTRSDFMHNSKGAYDSAKRNGWLNQVYSNIKTFDRKDLNLYWTKELCQTKALLCDTCTEFRKKYGGAYRSAKRHNWLNEMCQHMINKTIWTLELCITDAKKYQHKSDWQKNNYIAYNSAQKNMWLDKCCSHMKRKIGSGGRKKKWTMEKCLESALKCESFVEWKINDKNAYINACKYGWFEICVKHMKKYK